MTGPKKQARRRQLRAPCRVPVVIAWTDEDGTERYNAGKCLEFSEAGLRIEVPYAIPYLSYVTLRLESVGLAASARVRHVRHRGLSAVIGLELREPLRGRVLEALSGAQSSAA